MGWIIIFLILAVLGRPASAVDPSPAHAWVRINYPPVAVKGVHRDIRLSVDSGAQDSEPLLKFAIQWSSNQSNPPWDANVAIGEPKAISARLHLSDGRIVLPDPSTFDHWMGFASGANRSWTLMYSFPWSANQMEEAWIELELPQQRYWVELPYGFTRKPSDPLVPDAHRSQPQIPEMKELRQTDLLVPWQSVFYELGKIEGLGEMSLRLFNHFGVRAEVALFRDKGGWSLDQPPISVETQWPEGHSGSECVGLRLVDQRHRLADFLLQGDREPVAGGRSWGTVTVHVDGKTYPCVVPSSLFKYTHGHRGKYGLEEVPLPDPPDGPWITIP